MKLSAPWKARLPEQNPISEKTSQLVGRARRARSHDTVIAIPAAEFRTPKS